MSDVAGGHVDEVGIHAEATPCLQGPTDLLWHTSSRGPRLGYDVEDFHRRFEAYRVTVFVEVGSSRKTSRPRRGDVPDSLGDHEKIRHLPAKGLDRDVRGPILAEADSSSLSETFTLIDDPPDRGRRDRGVDLHR